MCLRPVMAGLRSTGAGQGRAWMAYYRGKGAGGTSRGRCLILRLLGPVGEVVAGLQGFWVLGAQHLLEHWQQRGVLVAGRGRLPATPVKMARLPRMNRVAGRSGPDTRSRMGSSAANWSRAAAASPASPVQRARLW